MIEFDRPWRYMEDDATELYQERISFAFPDVQPYEIFPNDLDKRASAMLSILDNPKANRKYSSNQAINLVNLCIRANRQDLGKMIQEALSRRF